MESSETEDDALVAFARNVVASSYDEALKSIAVELGARRWASKENNAFTELDTLSDEEKFALIASKAAEYSLFHFFYILDQIDSVSITIKSKSGDEFDLREAWGIPLISAFDEDGWINSYSNFSGFKGLG